MPGKLESVWYDNIAWHNPPDDSLSLCCKVRKYIPDLYFAKKSFEIKLLWKIRNAMMYKQSVSVIPM